MVSNVLGMDADELAIELTRLAQAHGDDREFVTWRSQFPPDWPF